VQQREKALLLESSPRAKTAKMPTKAEVRSYMVGLSKNEHDELQAEIAAGRWATAGTALLAAAAPSCSESPLSPSSSSSSRRRRQVSLLLHTPDVVALRIVSLLDTAVDLARLGAVCQRYRTKSIVAPIPNGAALLRLPLYLGPVPEAWSMTEEAARLRVVALPEPQRSWVPRRGSESWVGLLHELEGLRMPLVFTLGGPHVQFHHRPAGHEAVVVGVVIDDYDSDDGGADNFECAVCGCSMRAGRHWAEIEVEFEHPLLGVVSRSFDPTGGGEACGSTAGQAAMLRIDGLAKEGDRVGALLDLDVGSLEFYLQPAGTSSWFRRRDLDDHPWEGEISGGLDVSNPNVGPLRWAVDLSDAGKATITGGEPPENIDDAEAAVDTDDARSILRRQRRLTR
jgi:hypothetical protein